MRNHVLAVDDLLEHAREDGLLVHVEVDAVQLAQADEVGPDKNPELFALELALFALARVALVLQAHPKLVHLNEVGEHERDRVLQVAAGPLARPDGEVVARLAREVVPQKEAARGVLHAAGHLHHVFHDLLDGGVGDRHVNGADGDHEVETGSVAG